MKRSYHNFQNISKYLFSYFTLFRTVTQIANTLASNVDHIGAIVKTIINTIIYRDNVPTINQRGSLAYHYA